MGVEVVKRRELFGVGVMLTSCDLLVGVWMDVSDWRSGFNEGSLAESGASGSGACDISGERGGRVGRRWGRVVTVGSNERGLWFPPLWDCLCFGY